MRLQVMSIASTVAFSKDASPPAGIFTGEPFILPAETSPILLRKCSGAIQQAFVRFAVTGGASFT